MVYDSENKIWRGPIIPPVYNPEASLGFLILNSIKLTPERILLTVDNFDVTCEEIFKKSIKIVKFFQSIGLEQNDIVGLLGASSENLFVVLIACLTLGLPINPLPRDLSEDKIEEIFSRTQPKILICDSNLTKIAENVKQKNNFDCAILTLLERINGYEFVGDIADDKEVDVGGFEFPSLSNISSTPAFILCSSSSSSPKKLIIRTHKQLIWGLREFPSVKNSPKIQFSPTVDFYSLYSVFYLFQMSFFGFRFVTSTKKLNAEKFVGIIEEKNVSFVQIFPDIFNELKKSGMFKEMKNVKHVMIAGSIIDENYVKEVQKVFPCAEIFAGFGTTETSFCVSGIIKKYFGSSGTVRPNFEVKIINNENKNLGPNESGEICIKSPVMFSNYFGDLKESSDAIKDGWFHTGHVGYFNEEGFLYVTKKKKDASFI